MFKLLIIVNTLSGVHSNVIEFQDVDSANDAFDAIVNNKSAIFNSNCIKLYKESK